MLIFLTILSLLSLVVGFLSLSAAGHILLKANSISTQVAETFRETKFQSRVTRKMLREDFDTRIYPKMQIEYPPEPTQLEVALGQLERGETVTVPDFGALGRK